MRLGLRVITVALAIAAVIDPAFTIELPQPVPIDVRLPPGGAPDFADAVAARGRLFALLGDRVVPAHGAPAAAVVLIGAASVDRLPGDVPVSAVALRAARPPNVRILRVDTPASIVSGQVAAIVAHVESTGMRGMTTAVALEQDGVRLAQASKTWSGDRERAEVSLPFAPPRPGMYPLRIAANVVAGERDASDNTVDVALSTPARRLRVLSYEPRPSWAAAFVRRALEAEAVFETASIVSFSKGLEVRAGDPPPAMTAVALDAYDAVLVGAPEALTANDVAALDRFVRVRGGLAVLLPDRRPVGAYVRLLPGVGFDEALFQSPVEAAGALGKARGWPQGSEFALLRQPGAGVAALGTVEWRGRARTAIASWPAGAGRVIFSGALDAWRYRARGDGAFARFWAGTIAGYASASPPPVAVTAHPRYVSPGTPMTIRVVIRQTEFTGAAGAVVVPPVRVGLTDERGVEVPLRVWPTAEAGVFEGTLTAPATGRYIVKTGRAETPILVADDVHQAGGEEEEGLQRLATLTGGVATSKDDLAPLEQHLSARPRPVRRAAVHPARSAWWFWAFTATACAEWVLRRRAGQR